MGSRPNLFVIGAMKSGTTTMHTYLNSHPDIAMSKIKEPGYFVEEIAWKKGEDWYCGLFEDESSFRYRGESSTHYTKLPTYQGVAQRIHEFNPDARLIYVVREPFSRMVSHYWHAVRDFEAGGERRTLRDAIKPGSVYLTYSDYVFQLMPYIEKYGLKRILVISFEELSNQPVLTMRKVFQWLELDDYKVPEDIIGVHNERPDALLGVAGRGLLNRIQYSPIWSVLSAHVPSVVRRWGVRMAYQEIDEGTVAVDCDSLEVLLRPTLRRQIDAFERLIERTFTEWAIEPL